MLQLLPLQPQPRIWLSAWQASDATLAVIIIAWLAHKPSEAINHECLLDTVSNSASILGLLLTSGPWQPHQC
jgi:hypothetical protein